MSAKVSLDLYPEAKPFRTERLQVSPLHSINIEQYGNGGGQPILFLHGGPGSGINSYGLRLFCPDRYHLISFDQRGCGKSQPFLSLQENTIWHLVEDIEKIRQHLNIKRWHLAGGSWGCTLALAYAEKYPQTVNSLILWSIFLGRKKEIAWFYQQGANAIFPEAWQDFLHPIAKDDQKDLVSAYYKQLTSSNKNIQRLAANAWNAWDANALQLLPPKEAQSTENDWAIQHALLECHYFVNRCFLEKDDQLLENIGRIRHIPTTIIHGRYDLICPVETAWLLHNSFPEAEFIVVPDAAHSAKEASNAKRIIQASDKNLLSGLR